MEQRIVLACIAATGCAVFGRVMSATVRNKAALTAAILETLRRLRIQIAELLEPLERSLRATELPAFIEVAGKLSPECGAAQAWREVVRPGCKREIGTELLSEEECNAIESMFVRIGEGGREEQARVIGACIAEFEEFARVSREKAAVTSGLYTHLGILAGLMLAILMI